MKLFAAMLLSAMCWFISKALNLALVKYVAPFFLFFVCLCKLHIVCEGVIDRKAFQYTCCISQVVYLTVLLYLGQWLKLGSLGGELETGFRCPGDKGMSK